MLSSKQLLKNDVEYILKTVQAVRYDIGCLLDEKDGDIRIQLYDFNTYRKMILSLLQTYDSLNLQYDHRLYQEDNEFVVSFISDINTELSFIEVVKKHCTENYNQYRCLQDIALRINNHIHKIYKANSSKPQSNLYVFGEKDRAKMEAILNKKVKEEKINPNIKAVVLCYGGTFENDEFIPQLGSYIPFSTIEGAEDYIVNELEPLGLGGMAFKINE